MKKNKTRLFFLMILWIATLQVHATDPLKSLPSFPETGINFIIANDLGRNGYYEQKPIARLMGEIAGSAGIKFIAAAGDVHHFGGVASITDPLWMTNYELIYDHPELMIDWYPILGNHEYRGNTRAVLDYSQVSRRWVMPDRYYTHRIQTREGTGCLLVFIDTTPLMTKYRQDSQTYPDALLQDDEKQLQWIDSVLVHSPEEWKIVIGHHPVYAETKKSADERDDMQRRLGPILEKNRADIYFCGHIHNFQHIRPRGSVVEYVVNSAASLSRKVEPLPETRYCKGDPGFTVCNVDEKSFSFFFVNHQGEIIYNYSISK